MTKRALSADALERLLDLLRVSGASGFEERSIDLWEAQAESVGTVSRDAINNAWVTVVAGPGGSPRTALFGHIDQIGFLVTSITPQGLVKFGPIGGWDHSLVMGQRVRVVSTTGDLPGVVGGRALHQISNKEAKVAPKMSDMWIDVGAVDAGDARSRIAIGDPILLDAVPVVSPPARLMSPCLDNRVGTFVALEATRRVAERGALDAGEVIAVAARSEETLQFGAEAVVSSIVPDRACVIDLCIASDVPGDHDDDVELGKGPVISFGATVSNRLAAQLVDVAREQGIPYQVIAAGRLTLTDADVITSAGAGYPTAVVSVPGRYLHSPGEVVDMGDIAATIDLLTAWCEFQPA